MRHNRVVEPLFVLRVILRSWLLPPAGPLVLALVGLWLMRRRPRLGGSIVVAGVGVLLAMCLPLVADRLAALVGPHAPLDLQRPVDAQAVVVLAGGTRAVPGGAAGEREPSTVTLERLAYGARVVRATRLPLLLSGGVVIDGEPESASMDRVLRADFGLAPRWLETRSRNTHENARESARLLRDAGVRRIVLVTSTTHLRRAAVEFEAAGLEVVPAPVGAVEGGFDGIHDVLPSISALQRSSSAAYELAGLAVARLGGR
ncbi:MAG: YdcF family protein [Steroidobacteraceae bacterium]|nr:YdcF family protein [Steroidobacteraceae bacterium]